MDFPFSSAPHKIPKFRALVVFFIFTVSFLYLSGEIVCVFAIEKLPWLGDVSSRLNVATSSAEAIDREKTKQQTIEKTFQNALTLCQMNREKKLAFM
jgi:hypothetical protein